MRNNSHTDNLAKIGLILVYIGISAFFMVGSWFVGMGVGNLLAVAVIAFGAIKFLDKLVSITAIEKKIIQRYIGITFGGCVAVYFTGIILTIVPSQWTMWIVGVSGIVMLCVIYMVAIDLLRGFEQPRAPDEV